MTDIRKKLAGKVTKLAQDRPKLADHPAATMNDCREGSYYQLDVSLILPDPDLPEQQHDTAALAELADSLRHNGLYQPIVVRRDEAGRIMLVVGSRRLEAAKMAGLEKIPAIFTEGNPREISLIEKLQWENLTEGEESVTGGQKPEPQGHREIKPAVVIVETPVAVSAAIACSPSPAAITDVCHREDDVYKAGERRNNQLVMELQNLVKILDGLIMDGK